MRGGDSRARRAMGGRDAQSEGTTCGGCGIVGLTAPKPNADWYRRAMSELPHAERGKYRRTPYLVVTREKSERKDVYGSIGDAVARQAQLLRGERDSDTVIVAMHP